MGDWKTVHPPRRDDVFSLWPPRAWLDWDFALRKSSPSLGIQGPRAHGPLKVGLAFVTWDTGTVVLSRFLLGLVSFVSPVWIMTTLSWPGSHCDSWGITQLTRRPG